MTSVSTSRPAGTVPGGVAASAGAPFDTGPGSRPQSPCGPFHPATILLLRSFISAYSWPCWPSRVLESQPRVRRCVSRSSTTSGYSSTRSAAPLHVVAAEFELAVDGHQDDLRRGATFGAIASAVLAQTHCWTDGAPQS